MWSLVVAGLIVLVVNMGFVIREQSQEVEHLKELLDKERKLSNTAVRTLEEMVHLHPQGAAK